MERAIVIPEARSYNRNYHYNNNILQFGIMLPFSRTMESEGDFMGLVFMNLAGYNLRDSVEVWKRMQLTNEGKNPPEFMSSILLLKIELKICKIGLTK